MLLHWLRGLVSARRPSRARNAQALYLKGESLSRAGRYEEAVQFLGEAVSANPDVADFQYELGAALFAKGEFRRAAQSLRKTIELEPQHVAAHIDFAAALLALGMPAAAEHSCRNALQLAPAALAAHVNLGSALEAQGRFAQASMSFRSALDIDPECVQALCNLSSVSLKLGEVEEARRSAERAVQADPRFFEARMQQGEVLLEQKLPAEAAQSFQEALRLRPDSAIAQSSLGCVFDLKGQIESAMECYEKALALDAGCIQAHINRAAVWLLTEDYARGWPEFEWRLRAPENAAVHERFQAPRWDGASLEGRTILVYAEQGLGDQIMYASCLSEVIARAGHCVIDCDARLAALFRRSFPRATVHGGRQGDPADWLKDVASIDVKISAGSLPLHLRRVVTDFPRHRGYLRADPDRVRHWRSRLEQLGPGMKVGLSWRGGVARTSRAWRSLGLADLLPVLGRKDLSFVSLQYGDCQQELARLRHEHGIELHHWQEAIDDYDETAALVCALDLTVSVCTALVHLAGALGRRVWVMAPLRPESRYGFSGDTMRWYPSARMFRQPALGDWNSVIAGIAQELK